MCSEYLQMFATQDTPLCWLSPGLYAQDGSMLNSGEKIIDEDRVAWTIHECRQLERKWKSVAQHGMDIITRTACQTWSPDCLIWDTITSLADRGNLHPTWYTITQHGTLSPQHGISSPVELKEDTITQDGIPSSNMGHYHPKWDTITRWPDMGHYHHLGWQKIPSPHMVHYHPTWDTITPHGTLSPKMEHQHKMAWYGTPPAVWLTEDIIPNMGHHQKVAWYRKPSSDRLMLIALSDWSTLGHHYQVASHGMPLLKWALDWK